MAVSHARAHGPCSATGQPCLSPASGPPGTEVTVTRTTAFRVVWNEDVDYMGSPGNRALRAILLTERRTARTGVAFTVPDVPTGVYPVVIYDGSEGLGHYTWDYFEVVDNSSSRWLRLTVLVGLVIVETGAIAAVLWRQRFANRFANPSNA